MTIRMMVFKVKTDTIDREYKFFHKNYEFFIRNDSISVSEWGDLLGSPNIF